MLITSPWLKSFYCCVSISRNGLHSLRVYFYRSDHPQHSTYTWQWAITGILPASIYWHVISRTFIHIGKDAGKRNGLLKGIRMIRRTAQAAPRGDDELPQPKRRTVAPGNCYAHPCQYEHTGQGTEMQTGEDCSPRQLLRDCASTNTQPRHKVLTFSSPHSK